MSDTFLTAMREKLLELQGNLESLAATGEESSKVVELDQSRVGRLSRMDALQAQAMAQASERRRKIILQKITAALTRIQNDEYGLCLVCDEPIDRKRLEFDPTVTLCVQCAENAGP